MFLSFLLQFLNFFEKTHAHTATHIHKRVHYKRFAFTAACVCTLHGKVESETVYNIHIFIYVFVYVVQKSVKRKLFQTKIVCECDFFFFFFFFCSAAILSIRVYALFCFVLFWFDLAWFDFDGCCFPNYVHCSIWIHCKVCLQCSVMIFLWKFIREMQALQILNFHIHACYYYDSCCYNLFNYFVIWPNCMTFFLYRKLQRWISESGIAFA